MDTEILRALPSGKIITIIIVISLVICVSLVIVVLGVTSSGTSSVKTGSEWFLESYTDATGVLVPVMTGTDITAQFGRDANITGTSGCNQYVAAYLLNGNLVAITPPLTTKINCSKPGIMQQENAYLMNLPNAASIQMSTTEMKILDKNKKVILEFRSE
jgi:heat shock protein HslJ